MEEMTKEWAQGILNEWDEFQKELEEGNHPSVNKDIYDGGIFEDEDYADYYIWGATAEFCFTKDKESEEIYLSDEVAVAYEGGYNERFTLEELIKIVEEWKKLTEV